MSEERAVEFFQARSGVSKLRTKWEFQYRMRCIDTG